MKRIAMSHIPSTSECLSAINVVRAPRSSRQRVFLRVAWMRVAVFALIFTSFTASSVFGYCSPTSTTETCLEHAATLPANGGASSPILISAQKSCV